MRCPGQDTRYWKPGDIFDVPCPSCSTKVEFCKDDVARRCHECGTRFRNPRIDLGCLEWCQYADKCLAGQEVENQDPWSQAPRKDEPAAE